MNPRQHYPAGEVGDKLFLHDLQVATPGQREEAILRSVAKEQHRHVEFLKGLIAMALNAESK